MSPPLIVGQKTSQPGSPLEPPDQVTAWSEVFDCVGEAVFFLNDQEEIVLWNRSAASILGCGKSDVLGKSAASIPVVNFILKQLKSSSSDSAATQQARRIDATNPNGQALSLEASLISQQCGPKLFHIFVGRDLSRRQRPGQTQGSPPQVRALHVLLRTMAHDLNNIFTAVQSHLDLIAMSELPPSTREHLTVTIAGMRRGMELVRSLSSLHRSSVLCLEPLDLAHLANRSIAAIRRSLPADVTIRIEFPSGPWPAHADGNHLLQVLINLCLDAAAGMPKGGEIVLRMRKKDGTSRPDGAPQSHGGFIRLTVSDSGQSISVAQQKQIAGAGLDRQDLAEDRSQGLRFAQQVLCDHKGWLQIEPDCCQGNDIHLFLPYGEATDKSSGQSMELEEQALEGKETILIVDDEEDIRMIIRAALGYRGYQTIEAANGLEAVKAYTGSAQPIDLVLMDLDMPVLNGWNALIQIRQRNPQAKVILLSGSIIEDEVRRAAQLGAVGFFENHSTTGNSFCSFARPWMPIQKRRNEAASCGAEIRTASGSGLMEAVIPAMRSSPSRLRKRLTSGIRLPEHRPLRGVGALNLPQIAVGPVHLHLLSFSRLPSHGQELPIAGFEEDQLADQRPELAFQLFAVQLIADLLGLKCFGRLNDLLLQSEFGVLPFA